MSFLESIQDGLLERGKENEKEIFRTRDRKHINDHLNESEIEETKTCLHSDSLNLMQWKPNGSGIMECDSSTAFENQTQQILPENVLNSNGKGMDDIAIRINNTLQELNSIYKQIGFSTSEISLKKSEMFDVIEDTIFKFTNSLQRERVNIENECEWLRQQIRIILAMMNDNNGEKSLSVMERGIVYKDRMLFERGYKEDTLHSMALSRSRKESFYEPSMFNQLTGVASESSLFMDSEGTFQQILHLSLIEEKQKLNVTFLEALKTFMKPFKALNDLTISLLDVSETIGTTGIENDVDLLNSLPNRTEVETNRELIENFQAVIRYLKLTERGKGIESIGLERKSMTFVIPSPLKNELKNPNKSHKMPPDSNLQKDHDLVQQLRELNYKFVKIIRSLKLSKITPEILSQIQRQIEKYNREFYARKSRIEQIIERCFELVGILHLTDDQLLKIQKYYDNIKTTGLPLNEIYFDKETLQFIRNNPKEFGLTDKHLEFISHFELILQKVKNNKQKKMNYYLENCRQLWTKLHEDEEYYEKFLKANRTLTDLSLINFKMEFSRLLNKRSEYIEGFIIDTRKSIEEFWDSLYYSENQRAQFKYYTFNMDSALDKEIVLNEHELELSKLNNEFSSKRHILEMYRSLLDLLKDQDFLKESSKDSSRLLSKNSCKILANEEKIRKRIIKTMPKLFHNLKAEVLEYNNVLLQNGTKSFTVYEEDLFEKLLFIESEQLSQTTNRTLRNKLMNRSLDFDTKKSDKISPTRRQETASSSQKNRASSGNDNTNMLSSHIRRSNYSVSPTSSSHKHAIYKPRQASNQNPRLAHALNISLTSSNESGSMSTLESPVMSAGRTNSNSLNHNEFQTHPLSSTMSPFGLKDSEEKGNEFHKRYMKLSPVKLDLSDCKDMNERNLLSPLRISPLASNKLLNERIRNEDNLDATNKRGSITLTEEHEENEENKENENDSAFNKANFDNSTLCGDDDYEQWKNEKIRHFN